MADCAGFEGPPLQFIARNPFAHQISNFLGSSSTNTRDIAIVDPDEWYNGHNISKEKVPRRVQEVEWRAQHCQRPKQADKEERGQMSRLQFEDASGSLSDTYC